MPGWDSRLAFAGREAVSPSGSAAWSEGEEIRSTMLDKQSKLDSVVLLSVEQSKAKVIGKYLHASRNVH